MMRKVGAVSPGLFCWLAAVRLRRVLRSAIDAVDRRGDMILMLSQDPDGLQVFTDGSFDARSGTGGWGYVAIQKGRPIHAARGSGRGLSNNTFELMAVFEALSWLAIKAPGRNVTVWTDSAHVLEGCLRWRAIWRNNGWRRIDPNPNARRRKLPDASIWRGIDALLQRHPTLTLAWCKAHSGLAGNDHADALAAGRAPVEGFRAPT